MNPKKIAFVCDAIYPYHKGGKETRLYEISTRLAIQGYDVHIYCMKWWKGKTNRVENGVHLHGISPYMPLYEGPRRSIKQGVLFGIFCFKLLAERFDVIDVDHMPFFPLYSMRIVCWLKGKKMIGTWNEVWGKQYWEQYLDGHKATVAALIEKYAISLPDKIISISPMTSSKLVKIFHFPERKIDTIPCGYSDEVIQASEASPLKSDIIYVGRLLRHKNVNILLEAVAELKKTAPHILCRIVGTGPEEGRLKNQQKQLKLEQNVVFHGELPDHNEVFSLMKSSRVFVLPSTREGFGIVVLEANACGIPVITAEHEDNAATAIAQEKAKLHSQDFAVTIKKVLDSDKKMYSAQIRKNVDIHRWNYIIEQLKKAYQI